MKDLDLTYEACTDIVLKVMDTGGDAASDASEREYVQAGWDAAVKAFGLDAARYRWLRGEADRMYVRFVQGDVWDAESLDEHVDSRRK